MYLGNGDKWAAQFLAREPDYSEFDWLDTYAMVLSQFKPELTPRQGRQAALDAYVRGSWMNPKVTAALDALLGRMSTA